VLTRRTKIEILRSKFDDVPLAAGVRLGATITPANGTRPRGLPARETGNRRQWSQGQHDGTLMPRNASAADVSNLLNANVFPG
jgi:hypothetical protein